MKLYGVFIYVIFSEVVILFLCSFFLLTERIYFFYKERKIQENKRLLSSQILDLLQVQKNGQIQIKGVFAPSLILSVVEEFNHRFNGVQWEEIKRQIVSCYLLSYAREYVIKSSWRKRLFSSRCFALYAESEDCERISRLIEDKEFLVFAKACLAAMRLNNFFLTKQIVQKASCATGYPKYFLLDLLRRGNKTLFQDLEKIVLETDDMALHKICCEVLSYKAFPIHLPILYKYLSSSDHSIRLIALRFFIHHPVKEIFSILSKAVDDADPNIQKEALLAMPLFSTDEALPILQKALQDYKWSIKIAAATALLKMGMKAQGIIDHEMKDIHSEGSQAIRYVQEFG